jgi:starch-binding outer membrane protein, SusD/RagB family
MRVTTVLPALVATLLVGACNSLGVTDLNNPGLDDIQNSPTRAGVLSLATGLQVTTRYGEGQQIGPNAELGILGRELYNLDGADPRYVTEMLIGPLDGGSGAFGGNLFAQPYSSIRTANVLLRALDKLPTDPADPQTGMTTAEKEATLGYTQTLQAYDFLRAINTRDDFGAPVDVDIDPTGEPAPIKTKAEVFAHIVNLLDSAKTHLQAGGATFPFPMGPGYAGFDKPATFLKFNRALRARVAVYLDDFATALTLLADGGETFINTAAPLNLNLGVYHTFSTTPGDSTNNLFDPNGRALVAHPSLEADADTQANGAKDQRFIDKTLHLAEASSGAGLVSNWALNVYKSPTAPIPIIRNEELILLRAEANIGLNQLGPALTDINLIRQTSGNLPAHAAFGSQAEARDELLYNKRYSLLFEGYRWIDLRHYGLLNTLPTDATNFGNAKRFRRFPFPSNECLARNPQPAEGCSPEQGF